MNDIGNIGKRNPFRVPENYFDNFTEDILERSSAKSSLKKRKIFSIKRPGLAVAAAVAGFLLISYLGLKIMLNGTPDNQLISNLSEYSEILSYDIDEYMIVDELSTDEVADLPSDITNDDIIDYLLLNDVDFVSIEKNIK